MFCPKCGAPEQAAKTFCRNCGIFLPDFEKIKKKEVPIEEHIKINSFFTLATAIVSLTLAILLYATFISNETAPFVIYPVFGFLMAMTAWQIQTYIRTRIIKKRFEDLRPPRDVDSPDIELFTKETPKALEEANFENAVPATVTEMTTRNLSKVKKD